MSSEARPGVLIADDSAFMRRVLADLIESSGRFRVVGTAPDGREAIAQVRRSAPDLITMDGEMPVLDGLEFLRGYRAAGGPALVIMMSAYGGEGAAIAPLKEGAYDYLPKTFPSDAGRLTLRTAREREQVRGPVASLTGPLERRTDRLVGEEPRGSGQVSALGSR